MSINSFREKTQSSYKNNYITKQFRIINPPELDGKGLYTVVIVYLIFFSVVKYVWEFKNIPVPSVVATIKMIYFI